MPQVKSSLSGRIRRMAYEAWRGPRFAEKEEKDTIYGGRLIAYLALRTGDSMKPSIASRAVFADFNDSDDALLRAVLWKREWYTPQTLNQIAIRYVRIPQVQVQHWLMTFNTIPLLIQSTLPTLQTDDTLPIRTLRLEPNPVYATFEKTWQVTQPLDVLDHHWEKVWNEMEQNLKQFDPIYDVEERFPCAEFTSILYNFDLSPV